MPVDQEAPTADKDLVQAYTMRSRLIGNVPRLFNNGVVASAAAVLLMPIGCTPDPGKPLQGRSYKSADPLLADLEEHNDAWSCDDTTSLRGYIGHPNEIDSAQCALGDDPANATVHIWDPDKKLRQITKFDNGPYIWWVSGPNWFVATPSEQLADDIQEALGGIVTSSEA